MKLAIVDGQKVEAAPSAKGACVLCGFEMTAKCGEIKIWHWAHKGKLLCDLWWENETEWHRAWKNLFPFDWQEVIHVAENGDKHIADVKTDQGWVLEFQHSHLDPEERRTRNAFYRKLIWIVDGASRKRGKSQFFKALEGSQIRTEVPLWSVFSDESELLRDWAGSHAPVFFDFGEGNQPEGSRLWCLLPGGINGKVHVTVISRSEFISFHQPGSAQAGRDFAKLLNQHSEIISLLHQVRVPITIGQPSLARRRPSFRL